MAEYALKALITLDSSQFDKGLDQAKTKTNSFGSVMKTGLKAAGVAIGAATAAVGAFAKSSIDAGMQFDSSMSQVAATMGKSMSEMEQEVGTATISVNGQIKEFSGNLREFAQVMGENTAFSASQAADALNYMALAGYDVQTSMNMLPNVLNLAAAGSMDLARASDMVTDTATAFGMVLEDGTVDIERTTQMVDEMAKAASTGNTSVEQLGDAFLTVGGLAQELNGGLVELADGTTAEVDGVQELEIALTAMANAGIKGSEAGTHMRNMLLKLASPTDQGAKQLEALGVSAFDAEGNMRSLNDIFSNLHVALGNLTQQEKLQAISDLFNTRDIASSEALLEAVMQDWDGIGEAILNADGAAQQMADTQLDNLAGDVTRFKSALEGAQIAISDSLSPTLREFVQFGTNGIQQISEAFKEGGLTGAMQAFGQVLSDGLNMIISKIPEFINAGMELLGALGEGLLSNLPVIIDAAVQIVPTIIDGILTALPQLVDGALQIIIGLANGISEMLPSLIPSIVQVIIQIVQTIIDNIPMLVEAANAIVTGLMDGIMEALPMLLEAIPDLFSQLVDALIAALPTLIQGTIQLVMGIVNALPEIILAIVDAIPQIIGSIVEALIGAAPQLILGAIQLVLALVAALPEIIMALIEAIPTLIVSIAEAAASCDEAFKEAMRTLVDGMIQSWNEQGSVLLSNAIQTMSNLLTNIGQFLAQLPEQMAYWAGYAVGQFITFMQQLPTKIVQVWNNFMDSVRNFGQNLSTQGPKIANDFKTKLINGFKDLPGKMIEIGKNIVEGLKNGIKNSWDSFTSWVKGLVGDFISGLKGGLGISSPSKVMANEIGRWIPAGVAMGIENGSGVLYDAIDDMNNIITTPTGTIGGTMEGLLGSFANSNQSNDVNVYVTLEGDADRLFRVVQNKATSNYRLTGQKDLVTV